MLSVKKWEKFAGEYQIVSNRETLMQWHLQINKFKIFLSDSIFFGVHIPHCCCHWTRLCLDIKSFGCYNAKIVIHQELLICILSDTCYGKNIQLSVCFFSEFVMVHNGIITNYKEVKAFLVSHVSLNCPQLVINTKHQLTHLYGWYVLKDVCRR